MRLVERAARGVLDPERIQRHSIRHRMDARIDDRRARHRQRAGDLAKKPRMVGGIIRDFGDGARRQRLRVHSQGRLALFRVAQQARMP